MIKVVICLVAEGVVRDAETDGISIFNILEGVMAPGYPLFMQRLSFFALLERSSLEEPQAQHLHFRISLGETELYQQDVDIDFIDKIHTRLTIHIRGLLLPAPGDLKFELRNEGAVLTTYLIKAKGMEQPVVNIVAAAAGGNAMPH